MAITRTANVRTGLPEAALAIARALSPKTPQTGAIARSEFKFLTLFALALCIVTTLPYVAGHLVSFPGTLFTDVLTHSLDQNNFLAYARQPASGSGLSS